MANWLLQAMSATHRFVYRATRGKLGGTMVGVPILLLTTTGRKTGKKRTTPLMYGRDGDRFVVIASYAGAPQHPAWWTNLVADPNAEIEVGGDRLRLRAREATEEERPRLWSAMAALYPTYDDYQKKTERRIPVVVLEPVA